MTSSEKRVTDLTQQIKSARAKPPSVQQPRTRQMMAAQPLDRRELEQFCSEAGYEARFVPADFHPRSEEDRLLIAPPERNMDVSDWQEQVSGADATPSRAEGLEDAAGPPDPELEAFRRRLEGLL